MHADCDSMCSVFFFSWDRERSGWLGGCGVGCGVFVFGLVGVCGVVVGGGGVGCCGVLGCVVLGWVGLGWVGLCCVVLDCVLLCVISSRCIVLCCVVLCLTVFPFNVSVLVSFSLSLCSP